MGRVIYLTGAPATGKSTLCSALKARNPNLVVLSYSSMLRAHIQSRTGVSLDAKGIRRRSSSVVTREDVKEVDELLVREVAVTRSTHDVIVDSHPVTKESFGFRVTPFNSQKLLDFNPDAIACLYADPEVLRQRICANPEGRPIPSVFELAIHVQTQCAVAAQYSMISGKSCYLLDTDDPVEVLAQRTAITLKLEPDNTPRQR